MQALLITEGDMYRSSAMLLAMVVAMVLSTAAGRAQDAVQVLETVRKAIGGTAPRMLRITAAGSGYALAEGSSRQHFRIESYTQEMDSAAPSISERLVRIDTTARDGQKAQRVDTRAANVRSPWSEQYRLWTTPHGFLIAAASRPTTVTNEKFQGSPYRLVTVTVDNGRQVRGYVNDDNILERTRTDFEDPALGKVQFEATYLQWADFNGMKFPTMIIEKENNEVSRILIVEMVEA
jgi:hypothetical protein